MTNKSIWWGAMPWEMDGGAVVNYYLLRKLNYLNPDHEFFCIPKVPQEADTDALPFAQFKVAQKPFEQIPDLMYSNDIPLLSMFHLSHEWLKVARDVHKVGGKTLVHQTIHWDSDDVFKAKKALQDVDAWVVPTKWGQEVLCRVGKIKEKNTKYIPHGVALDKFYPHKTAFRNELGLNKKQKVILFVGRCSRFKGAHELIPVMKPLIKEYDCVFILRAGVFGGLGSPEMKIGRMFELLANQNSNIFFIPNWCPPSYLEEIMASSDILVQPSGHEGFDVPLIEAMATKQAIAVSNLPNHKEILGGANRQCGIFMEPTEDVVKINDDKQMIKVPSSDMIYGTLKFLLENPDEADAMAKAGYKRVKKEYDLNKVGKSWLSYMNKLCPKNYEMKIEL